MVDAPTWPSIPAMALASAERFGVAEAVVQGDTRVSFAELGVLVRRSAAAMIAAGVALGDRVAIWAPNSLEWVVAALGLQAAGASLVPVNTRWKGEEAAYILERSSARLLCTVTGFLDIDPVGMLARARRDLPALDDIVVLDGDTPSGCTSWADFVAAGAGAGVSNDTVEDRVAAVGPEDVCDILFTSGTTGRPKGVVMRHGQTLRFSENWCDFAGLRAGDRYLVVNPFFHMFGYKAGWMPCLISGAVLLPVPVFDIDDVLGIVERERVTVFPGAPTIYQSILDHPRLGEHDLSSLRVAVTGAADIPVELIRRMHTELPFTSIMTGYGLTEAATCTGSRPGDSFETIAGTAGRAMEGLEVRVVAANGMADSAVSAELPELPEVPRGETGEVVVRGYSVMTAYFDDPEATAAAIDAHGWLHTGDLGVMDDRGCLRIVGRIKDMFIVGGFNAYPAEIENTLLAHPTIAQVAVIGVPDDRLGEVGMAFCVLRPGARLDIEELTAWSRERMANYKVPRRFEVVDALPLNATGKVVKDKLRARALTAALISLSDSTTPDNNGSQTSSAESAPSPPPRRRH